MLKFVKQFINWLYKKRLSHKVSVCGDGVRLYRSTRILQNNGASKNNILLDAYSRLHGTLIINSHGFFKLGKYAQIGPNTVINCNDKIEIGDYTAISTGVIISDNNVLPESITKVFCTINEKLGDITNNRQISSTPIYVGKNCWIGENACICKGVHIGEGSIVAANAVVVKDVPSNCIVAGNPARIVKTEIDKISKRIFSE